MTNLEVKTDTQNASLLKLLLDTCGELTIVERSSPMHAILLWS